MIKLTYPSFWSKLSWISLLMLPFSYIYFILGWLRNKFTKTTDLYPRKVICVGNITVGGGGKTQIVAWLAQILKEKNNSFVIITKGYRSKLIKAQIVTDKHAAQDVGDESIILKKYGPVIAAKNIRYALPLIKQINPDFVILDDGMQNSYLRKDLQILAIDSLRGVGNNMIFPAGPLRESLSSGLRKADIIFIVGNNDYMDHNLINNIKLSKKPYFRAKIKIKENFDKEYEEYIAFAGIANPEKFFSLLEEHNVKLKQRIVFEDHNFYSYKDLNKLTKLAILNNSYLITTEKDYVKIYDTLQDITICVEIMLEIKNNRKCVDLIYEKLL